jgi:type VI secretion system protein ImpL
MHFQRGFWISVVVSVALLAGVAFGVASWRHPEWFGIDAGSGQQTIWLLGSAVTIVVLGMVLVYLALGVEVGRQLYPRLVADDLPNGAPVKAEKGEDVAFKPTYIALKAHALQHYGVLWRFKVRVLLVFGEPGEIDAIAPGLARQHWLEGENAILIWGGSLQHDVDAKRVEAWRGFARWAPLAGAVWVLTRAQSVDANGLSVGMRRLQGLSRSLRWHLPLHFWEVRESRCSQDGRKTDPVGCHLGSNWQPVDLEAALHQLSPGLHQQGWQQLSNSTAHDFLYRLQRDLRVEGIARWRDALKPWVDRQARGIPVRGIWFSLPLQPASTTLAHHWLPDRAWAGVLRGKQSFGQWRGRNPQRIAYLAMMALATLCILGLLISFTHNRLQYNEVQTAWQTLQRADQGAPSLTALNDLAHQLSQLTDHSQHGAPWYQRFSLNQSQPLLEAIWPRYIEANNRLIRDPAAARLHQLLQAIVQLPPASPERGKRAPQAYEQLKAYLMLANPEQADADFLVKALSNAEPQRVGLADARWLSMATPLWSFYALQLPSHPQWRIEPDAQLVGQVRQILLTQLGQRTGETALYRQVLENAAAHYPELGLAQLTGETDAAELFSTSRTLPGVFTRQAWEGHVRKAIDSIVDARREQIDWVLSDGHGDTTSDVSPRALKERLTQRYFKDYGSAWLGFLNSLRWQPIHSLGEAVDQLTLMTDIRQSPLIALMNTLAYQGQAGARGPALADSLIESAQKLVGKAPQPVIEQRPQGASGPLDATFGPLLALLGTAHETVAGDDQLSLQTFLTRVTRVRLKLQQVGNAPDPQAMTQALAQTVFQGKNDDLTNTQSYGALLAASLGAEWGGAGQALFVQPLEQAWQRVLQPSAASLNSQWQRTIVDHWHGAFAGRYPFAATHSDASLPMLGQMIRSDSGRIEQFLQHKLGGLLHKEGDRWVADAQQSQGLRFNPQFIAAVNQLSHLADVLYTDGGMGLSFELSGKPVRDIVQTTFVLDGEEHQYFNQKEGWQRFRWPGLSPHPGTSLTWTSVYTGERLFGDYQGTWGLIRLLEQAKATPLDDGDSRYQLVITAPDGIGLTWHLRTEMGAGPLALLKLRGFTLPREIFLTKPDAAQG